MLDLTPLTQLQHVVLEVPFPVIFPSSLRCISVVPFSDFDLDFSAIPEIESLRMYDCQRLAFTPPPIIHQLVIENCPGVFPNLKHVQIDYLEVNDDSLCLEKYPLTLKGFFN